MKEHVTGLWEFASAQCNPGASEEELCSFERQTGIALPTPVRMSYAACNGASLCDGLKIRSLAESLTWVNAYERCVWSYFPVTENYDSDPFCVCCASPLRGYVVYFSS